jgi:hypothetical protein
MIQKVKQWSYINSNFVIPLTTLREEIIHICQFNKPGYGQLYINAVNKAEAIADNLQITIRLKTKNKFPLDYKNCHYHNIDEFIINNPIELLIYKHLKLDFKCSEKNSKDERDLIGFFNYIVEDFELYSQIYFKLNS